MFFHVQEDILECRACGHSYHCTWTAVDKPAVKRFPVECHKCGAKEVYRAEVEDPEDDE